MLQAVLGTVVLCLMVLACTPPFDRDGLIHHLQVPKLYLQHGGIYEIPELDFSYYPMNLDLLYMGALRLSNDILPKYIHMAFGLATALLLHWHLKKRLTDAYAYLGAIFFLSIPIVVKLSVTVYVDLGLVFFSTTALLLLFRWLETKRRRDLLLAGICCGLGVGTKYNGLLVLFILAFMVPVLVIRSQEQQKRSTLLAIKAAMLFCAAALFVVSPWLVRNARWTGNPVYPLYNGLFSRAAAAPPSAEQTDTSTGDEAAKSGGVRGVFATRYVLYGENIWQLLILPMRIFFEGQDGDPRYFDGRLNPFLLLLPLLAFFGPTNRQVRLEQIALTTFCLLYFFYAFNIQVLRIRYLVPIMPFLVILSMYGLHNLEMLTQQHITNRRLGLLSWLLPVIMLLAWNGSYIWQQFQKIEPLSYIAGRVSRDEYLAKRIHEYPVMQYANRNLSNSAKILCIFLGRRGYYLDKPHFFDDQSNKHGLLAWLQQPKMSIAIVRQRLAAKGIGCLLIRRDLFAQWLRQTTVETQQLWVALEKDHLVPLASHLEYVLCQVN